MHLNTPSLKDCHPTSQRPCSDPSREAGEAETKGVSLGPPLVCFLFLGGQKSCDRMLGMWFLHVFTVSVHQFQQRPLIF